MNTGYAPSDIVTPRTASQMLKARRLGAVYAPCLSSKYVMDLGGARTAKSGPEERVHMSLDCQHHVRGDQRFRQSAPDAGVSQCIQFAKEHVFVSRKSASPLPVVSGQRSGPGASRTFRATSLNRHRTATRGTSDQEQFLKHP